MNSIAYHAADPQWPNGGFAFNRLDDRNFTVNEFGQPVSTVPNGNWQRGQIVRRYQPAFRPSRFGLESYDVTDPATWHNVRG